MGLEFNSSDIPSPGDENLDCWLEERISGMTDLSLENLKAQPQLAPGLEEIAYSDLKFNTPSGKVELLSVEAKRRWGVDQLPSYKEAFNSCNPENRFYHLTPNNRNRIHSQFGNLDIIKANDPYPMIQISLNDANKLGISDGDYVRVYNSTGEIRVRADITARIGDGCVALPNGWWKSEGGGGNQLSIGLETDMGYGTAFHDTKVSIEKAE
jgi:anaerobic selenocysteine-containing dehydrogenase